MARSVDLEERKAALLRQWAGTSEEQLEAYPLIIAYWKLERQMSSDPKLD